MPDRAPLLQRLLAWESAKAHGRRVAGDDIFISYARFDGNTYADSLADALKRKGFSVFIDRYGTEAGADIPRSLLAKLRECQMLVVVGSPAAARSTYVATEVCEFASSRGTSRIVPIDFGDSLIAATWYSAIAGVAYERESPGTLETGGPASSVVSRIENAFTYTRSKDRLARSKVLTAAAIAALLLVIIGASFVARDYRDRDESRRLAAQAVDVAPTDADLGIRLALEAVRTARTPDAVEALRRSLVAARVRVELSAIRNDALDSKNRHRTTAFSGEVLSPRGEFLIKSRGPRTLEVLSLRNGIRTEGNHAGDIRSVSVSPDDNLIASADEGGHALVWDPRTAQVKVNLTELVAGRSLDVVLWSPDGKLLFAGETDGSTTHVFNARDWTVKATFTKTPYVNKIAISPDSKLVATATSIDRWGTPEDRTAWVWDARTGKENVQLKGHEAGVEDVSFGSSPALVITSALEGQRLWSTESGRMLATWTRGTPTSGEKFSAALDLLEPVQKIDAGDRDTSGEGDHHIYNFRFSPDGKFLITVDRDGDGKLWDVATRLYVRRVNRLTDNHSHDFTFSADATKIISRHRDGTKVWQMVDGRELSPSPPTMTEEISRFMARAGQESIEGSSHDGRYMTQLDSDGKISIRDRDTGTLVTKVLNDRAVSRFAFSPDGSRIAVVERDSVSVRIYRWEMFAPVKDLLSTAVEATK